MADFAKRPEITVDTMGRVRNPTGEGVRAISAQVQAKVAKKSAVAPDVAGGGTTKKLNDESHETKVKEGTAKRNITRKKTAEKESGKYNSSYKKQGGHGKGEWKEMLDPSYVEALPLDENDPLYDAAEDSDKYVLTSGNEEADKRGYDPSTSKPVFGPMLTLQEFKFQLNECLREYFDSCDADEVIRTLEELGCQEFLMEVPKKAISLALDMGPRERELVSRLLTCLHPTPLTMDEMEAGFTALLDGLDELSTDVPEAKTMVASFLARAVVDEVLPPAFLSDQNNSRPGDEVIEKAVTLLSREHCTARLEKIWGPGDGRPVQELKQAMDQLLEEYLMSRELDEAARCVKELNCRHFHHELVKRGVKAAMEMDGPKKTDDPDALANIDAMAALFGFLVKNAILSEYQAKKGISRLHQNIPDISCDVPRAPGMLEAFEKMAEGQGCFPGLSSTEAFDGVDKEEKSG